MLRVNMLLKAGDTAQEFFDRHISQGTLFSFTSEEDVLREDPCEHIGVPAAGGSRTPRDALSRFGGEERLTQRPIRSSNAPRTGSAIANDIYT
jgi:hypothetical protein